MIGDFYERDFYPMSNFSAFKVLWKGILFDTSEHVYHWEKFNTDDPRANGIQNWIANETLSAHEVFKLAHDEREHRRKDWDNFTSVGRQVKVVMMSQIIKSKHAQHEYVQKKLRQAWEKNVKLSEKSWRDDFWGSGYHGNGQDWMGKLWNELAFSVHGPRSKIDAG